ncbi:MAG: hypothetical protein D6771_03695, partial [Zetaproteobacteria bacterium]
SGLIDARALLIAGYLLAGAAALAYELLWMRMLTILLGAGSESAIVTSGAFMLGLGAGAWLGAHRPRHTPVRLLLWGVAALEAALAGLALASGVWGKGLDAAADALAAALGWAWAAALVAGIAMVVPAWLMGVGFGWAARAAKPLKLPLGYLYGANTLGAALGALWPLVAMPRWGWWVALRWAAMLGLMGATCLGWAGARAGGLEAGVPETQRGEQRTALFAYALVGAAALMLEMGWMRLFGAVFMRTEYVMALLLAVYLAGIGLGGWLAHHIGRRWLAWLVPVASVWACLSVALLPQVARLWSAQGFGSYAQALGVAGIAVAVAMLPITLLLGLWLPWAAGRDEGGRWYAANSLGAALGAWVGGGAGLAWLGAPRIVVVASLLLWLAASAWVRRGAWLAGAAFVVPAALWAWPLAPSTAYLADSQGARELFRHEDALAWTSVVARADGTRMLVQDLRRMDAATDPTAVFV